MKAIYKGFAICFFVFSPEQFTTLSQLRAFPVETPFSLTSMSVHSVFVGKRNGKRGTNCYGHVLTTIEPTGRSALPHRTACLGQFLLFFYVRATIEQNIWETRCKLLNTSPRSGEKFFEGFLCPERRSKRRTVAVGSPGRGTCLEVPHGCLRRRHDFFFLETGGSPS